MPSSPSRGRGAPGPSRVNPAETQQRPNQTKVNNLPNSFGGHWNFISSTPTYYCVIHLRLPILPSSTPRSFSF
ncbi:hypothetical protein CDV31_006397 [Fusarium ambrosium]|uniref:Uncharacterized protein n=1 Tax=Fusarium ambrosium TaxID=131363 RepID=A0A428UDC6_9HYPO|nr:hypothetical protein CDV31_006397 [Fusarium ambrosium]